MQSEFNRLKEIRQEFIIRLSNNRWDKGVNKIFLKRARQQVFSVLWAVLQILNCHCSTLAAKDHMETNGQDCVPIKLYLKYQSVGQI